MVGLINVDAKVYRWGRFCMRRGGYRGIKPKFAERKYSIVCKIGYVLNLIFIFMITFLVIIYSIYHNILQHCNTCKNLHIYCVLCCHYICEFGNTYAYTPSKNIYGLCNGRINQLIMIPASSYIYIHITRRLFPQLTPYIILHAHDITIANYFSS